MTFSKTSFTKKHAILGGMLILTGSLFAKPPASLTPAQLQEFDQAVAPMKKQIEKQQQDTQRILDANAERSSRVDTPMKEFIENIGQKALLVQSKPVTPTAPAPKATKDPKDPKEKKDKVTTIKVECDGGLYFDNENGVLAYLKNVRLTEPRFNLTCSDELKVYLEQKPEKPAKKATAQKAGTAPTDKAAKKKDKSLSSFGDLKEIAARGNVKVVQKDDKGRLFIASAGSAVYNAKTGEMILKGGLPRLQQSKAQYLQAQEPGQWIRIHKNGKLVTSKGKWVMQTTTKKPTSTTSKSPTP